MQHKYRLTKSSKEVVMHEMTGLEVLFEFCLGIVLWITVIAIVAVVNWILEPFMEGTKWTWRRD
jgi:hypothetical protein